MSSRRSAASGRLEQREKGFDLSGLKTSSLDYNPLYDSNLRHFFESGGVQRVLRSSGMLDTDGRVIDMDRFKSKVNIIEQEFRSVEAEEEQRRLEEEHMRRRVRRKRYEALERARKQEKMQKMRQDRKIRAQILRVSRGVTPTGDSGGGLSGLGSRPGASRSRLAMSASTGILGIDPLSKAEGLYGARNRTKQKGKRRKRKAKPASGIDHAAAAESLPRALAGDLTEAPAQDLDTVTHLPRRDVFGIYTGGTGHVRPAVPVRGIPIDRREGAEAAVGRSTEQARGTVSPSGEYDYIDALTQEARRDAERHVESARAMSSGRGMGSARSAGTGAGSVGSLQGGASMGIPGPGQQEQDLEGHYIGNEVPGITSDRVADADSERFDADGFSARVLTTGTERAESAGFAMTSSTDADGFDL